MNDQSPPPRTPTQEVAEDASTQIATALRAVAAVNHTLNIGAAKNRRQIDKRPPTMKATAAIVEAAYQLLLAAEKELWNEAGIY